MTEFNPDVDTYVNDASPFGGYSAGIPVEPAPGSVVGFTVYAEPTEDQSLQNYPVTAMRVVVRGLAGKQWYCSGPRAPKNPITWDALLDLVGEDRWASIRLVDSWTKLEIQ